MPVMVSHIGEQVRQLRRERLLTQDELSGKSGVGVASIIRIERGQVEPRFSTIKKLAAGLEVDPVELVRGETQGWMKPKERT
jgi:transcriptional regulator with XRE-family HTH domain